MGPLDKSIAEHVVAYRKSGEAACPKCGRGECECNVLTAMEEFAERS